MRNSEKLLLLVAGIDDENRKDYRDRTIINSVTWVAEDNENNELILRAIAVYALRSFYGEDIDFKEKINNSIKSDQSRGFWVQFDTLNAHKLAATVKNEIKSDTALTKMEIGFPNADNAKKLVDDLKKFRLPNQQSPLVVFTGLQSQSVLKKAGVWRGYSSIEYQKETNPKFVIIVGLFAGLIIFGFVFFQPGKENTKPSVNEQKEAPAQISPSTSSTPSLSPSPTNPEPIPSPTSKSKVQESEKSQVVPLLNNQTVETFR